MGVLHTVGETTMYSTFSHPARGARRLEAMAAAEEHPAITGPAAVSEGPDAARCAHAAEESLGVI